MDKAFYTGSCNKEYFKKAFVRERKLVLAAHAVDNDFFQDPGGEYERKSREWRIELGIGENAIVFFLFAGETGKKEISFLAARSIQGQAIFRRTATLVSAGNGQLESSLRKKAGKERVHFIGFQNQSAMPAVYRMGDVFVLPSGGPGETWGLSINEAMACGRPVIASDKFGGTADLIQNGVNGYSFTSGSAEDLKEKMLLLLQGPGKIKTNGPGLALSHIQNFTLTRLAGAIEATALSPQAGNGKK